MQKLRLPHLIGIAAIIVGIVFIYIWFGDTTPIAANAQYAKANPTAAAKKEDSILRGPADVLSPTFAAPAPDAGNTGPMEFPLPKNKEHPAHSGSETISSFPIPDSTGPLPTGESSDFVDRPSPPAPSETFGGGSDNAASKPGSGSSGPSAGTAGNGKAPNSAANVEGKYWLETATGMRHNHTCVKFRNVPGRECTQDEGTPATDCGG